jgi:hypothetical protein
MISVEDFERLEVTDYLLDDQVGFSDDWRFLGRVWHCYGYGFTDFLETPDQPDVVRCICINSKDLPTATWARLLADLDLPLHPGMNIEEVTKVLGTPVRSESFVADRVSLEFQVGEFTVDTTIVQETGLTYLVIHPPLPPENVSDEYGLGDE